jgi:peptidyl-prolyl cis-trans isomerase B (cyclophilin B)
MAKQRHAAATEVTVAPLAEASGFEKFVNAYWKHGIVLFVLIAAGVLGAQYMQHQEKSKTTEEWRAFGSAVLGGFGVATPIVDAAELELLAKDATLDSAPWALMAAAAKHESDMEYSEALATLDRVAREHPEHLVMKRQVTIGERSGTYVGMMRERIQSLSGLAQEAPNLFGNADPAPDAPRVRLETTAGSIVVALYSDRAPKHVENFLELCREGQYDGTKFHRVMDGFMIQGGDRTSIDGPKEQWGTGDAGYTLAQEFSDLAHFPGFLAAAKKPNEVESGGHQFYITLGAPHHLDNVHTVFGKVVEGMDVVRAIGSAPNEPGGDRPLNPVTVTKTELL